MRNIPFTTTKRALLVCIAAAITGCATSPTPGNTLVDKTSATPALSTFSALLAKTDLADTLRGTGPFTVFAPSNEAFKALPAATLQDLNANPEKLKEVLSFHVVAEKSLLAADIRNGNTKSLNGANISLSKAGDFVAVESAVVTQADMRASNGVAHIIDAVLMPPVKK